MSALNILRMVIPKERPKLLLALGLGVSLALSALSASAQAGYQINAGDVLEVYVWNEESLTREVIVRPDGFITMPLAGDIRAGGQTPSDVEEAVATALQQYMKDEPTVTVSAKSLEGNAVYVLGKVNRPGQYRINRPTDVMQALAIAGGLNTFAAENDIKILRRGPDGRQRAIDFEYGEVKDGDDLDTNIILLSGDVVVVP